MPIIKTRIVKSQEAELTPEEFLEACSLAEIRQVIRLLQSDAWADKIKALEAADQYQEAIYEWRFPLAGDPRQASRPTSSN